MRTESSTSPIGITLVRGPYELTITLDSPTEGHDKWGWFEKVGPGRWREQWPEGENPVWREREEV